MYVLLLLLLTLWIIQFNYTVYISTNKLFINATYIKLLADCNSYDINQYMHSENTKALQIYK